MELQPSLNWEPDIFYNCYFFPQYIFHSEAAPWRSLTVFIIFVQYSIMRFLKIIGPLLFFSFLGLQNLNAQTQSKTKVEQKPPVVKKQLTQVKSVPVATKSKTALKSASKQKMTAHKQQIKKAVRKKNITRRPIRRR